MLLLKIFLEGSIALTRQDEISAEFAFLWIDSLLCAARELSVMICMGARKIMVAGRAINSQREY